jgi:hypothetical protein
VSAPNASGLRRLHDTDRYVVYSVGADGVGTKGDAVVAEEDEEPRDVGLHIRLVTAPSRRRLVILGAISAR